MEEEKHSIPIRGYGWGARDYGDVLIDVTEELEEGVEYIAKLEKFVKPDNWLDDESFPDDAIDLVLMKRRGPKMSNGMKLYSFTTMISVKAFSLKDAVRIFYNGTSQPWVHDNVVESITDNDGEEVDETELIAAQKAYGD